MSLSVSCCPRPSTRAPAVLRVLTFLRPVWTTALVAALVIALRVAAEVLAVYVLSPVVTNIAGLAGSTRPVGLWSWLTGNDVGAQKLRVMLLWAAAAQLALALTTYLRP